MVYIQSFAFVSFFSKYSLKLGVAVMKDVKESEFIYSNKPALTLDEDEIECAAALVDLSNAVPMPHKKARKRAPRKASDRQKRAHHTSPVFKKRACSLICKPKDTDIGSSTGDNCLRKTLPGLNRHMRRSLLLKFLFAELQNQDKYPDIRWTGDEKEFELVNPHVLANRWGQLRNRLRAGKRYFRSSLRRQFKSKKIIPKNIEKDIYRFGDNVFESSI